MEFEQILDEIAANEEEALELFELPEDTEEAVLIDAFRLKGIQNWQTNLILLDKLADFEIDEGFNLYLDNLKKYTNLQKDSFSLILKAIQEDSDDYNDQIDELNEKIEALIQKIQTMEDQDS